MESEKSKKSKKRKKSNSYIYLQDSLGSLRDYSLGNITEYVPSLSISVYLVDLVPCLSIGPCGRSPCQAREIKQMQLYYIWTHTKK